MSIATLILGKSGIGKTASIRNVDPSKTLLIQTIKKPLPFRSRDWVYFDADKQRGNIFVTDDFSKIIKAMEKTSKKIIIIDDFQYMMANEFMRRSAQKGYDKFTEIADHALGVMSKASTLGDDARVYCLSHAEESEVTGSIKMKTIGKLLDEKITPEGLFTTVLRATYVDGEYKFATSNNGLDTTKSPMGMFETQYIDNDLAYVDQQICSYYGINEPTEDEQS